MKSLIIIVALIGLVMVAKAERGVYLFADPDTTGLVNKDADAPKPENEQQQPADVQNVRIARMILFNAGDDETSRLLNQDDDLSELKKEQQQFADDQNLVRGLQFDGNY